MVSMAGCVQPFLIDSNRAGLGLFVVERRQLHPDVVYCRESGFGLILGDRLAFGFLDHRRVVARPSPQGFAIDTPLGFFAAGREAELVAPHLAKVWVSQSNQNAEVPP
jgi:hypothetical protein